MTDFEPDPRIAVVTEDDLPEHLRDPHELRENIRNAERTLERVPARYRNAAASVPEVRSWARTLIETVKERQARMPRIVDGPSLLLIGGTGSGKTYQAYGAIRALAYSGAGFSWQFVTAADLYAQLRPRHRVDSEEEFERFLRVTVLVLDDLGAAKATEWTEEVNYRLINWRYEHELPTLITSNVSPNQLVSALGDRVASRLVEMADRVVIKAGDRRLSSKGSAA